MNYRTAILKLPLVRETPGQRVVSPADVYRVCADMAELAQESFHILSINARNCLINRHLISLGLADAAMVHPRETYRQAILDGAAAVLVIHNHPSGDTTPSAEDVRITKQLIDAGKIIGIRLLDHIIIGRGVQAVGDSPGRAPYLSMRESGLCSFEG